MNSKLAKLAAHAEVLEKIEHVIHVKGRLSIVSMLAAAGSLTFSELRDLLGLTDGNLAAHLRALDDAGYLRMTRRDRSKGKVVTDIALTSSGRTAFNRYLAGLEQIVKRHR